MAFLSLALMGFIGLFTASTINQALVVLRGYAGGKTARRVGDS